MFPNFPQGSWFTFVRFVAEYVGVWACIYICLILFSILHSTLESALVSPLIFVVYAHAPAAGAFLGFVNSMLELDFFGAARFGIVFVAMVIPLLVLKWILTRFAKIMIGVSNRVLSSLL